MQRHRQVAASPERNAAEAWEVIRVLVADTLDASSSIDRTDVESALEPLDGVARMLISAGHLQKQPLVLIAGELSLEITTVSGTKALTLEENLNPVPGAATVDDWTLYVPQVEPMAKLVRTAVKGHAHLSADEPAAPAATTASGGRVASPVDLDALARRIKEGV